MEKQKIFWIVLSVSIFVVVVLVAGVLLLRQKPASAASPETVTPLSETGNQLYQYAQEKPQAPTVESTKPSEPEVLRFVIGEENKGKTEIPQPFLPTPQVAVQKPKLQAPQETRPAAPSSTPQKPAAQKPVPERTVRGVEYWIQTGSYKSQTKAEDLAKLLSDKGLSGRVFSYTQRNDTFYRVRIGPYLNRNEADKFLSTVKQIQGLESSYVSSVTSTRAVN
jgi:cell division protein FtsN